MSETSAPKPPPLPHPAPNLPLLPAWASDLIALYEAGARNQFILHGNVSDRLVLPAPDAKSAAAGGGGAVLGDLSDFILRVLLPRFDVVLSYDLGNGIRVEKGAEEFGKWPTVQASKGNSPQNPRGAVEFLTQFFRYAANLSRMGRSNMQVGLLMRGAHLIAPALRGGLSYDLAALSSLIRDWGSESLLTEHNLATFLVADNISDLHPIITTNPRAAQVQIPLPTVTELASAIRLLAPTYPKAMERYAAAPEAPAEQLAGTTLAAVESMLKTMHHKGRAIEARDLADLKKELVERDSQGLIDFIEPDRTLNDLYGQEKVKAWLRQDIALWAKGDTKAMPMGYLICGPVGTGKTYMVECFAGEAGVPVVKLKNFRDRWVGSTEGNLEKIFRLLHALGRCVVFVDEADQALGSRDAGAQGGDSGVGGRVYGMMAQEMSDTRNRGKILWILASSRPDLIEVDLKRPGRVDVKIPLFPTTEPEESFQLIRALCKRRGLVIDESVLADQRDHMPLWLTPGAAEALAVKVYRTVQTSPTPLTPAAALADALSDYQNPVPRDVMEFQIGLAVREASDLDFVPEKLRQSEPVTRERHGRADRVP
jgi:hypothetical protein